MRSKQIIQSCSVWAMALFLCAGIANAQLAHITWQQSQSQDTPVVIGTPTNVQVTGFPLKPYALLASRRKAVTNTLIGQLDIDLTDPEFTIGIDGFNPAHHLHHMGSTDVLGQYSFNFVPFDHGAPAGQRIYFQTVSQDPTAAPHGLALSNTVGTYAQPSNPRVDTVNPRSVFYGDFVTITGEFFTGSLGQSSSPIVTIGDQEMLIVSFSDTLIYAIATGGSHSGGIRVTSDVGQSPDLSYDPKHYVALIGNPTTELSQNSTPMDGHYSLVGEISSGTDTDTYYVTLEAGEELFVEVMNFDAATYVVNPFSSQNWNTVQLNSHVELRMPGIPIDPIVSNNDGAPGFAAGIGVVQAQRFVAPFSGDYELTVSSSFSNSQGHYLLNTWTKVSDPNQVPKILGLHPNYVAPGLEVEIYAIGLDLEQPHLNIAEFPGPNGTWLQSTMYRFGDGHISAVVPSLAQSGHIRIRNAANLISSFDADDFRSFCMIKNNLNVEDQTYAVNSAIQISGNISNNQEVDNYLVTANVNQKITARAFLYDPTTERLQEGKVFDSGYLDAEIRIREMFAGPIHVVDVHSGPATAAEIGGPALPPWNVPFTGSFELSVRSWLSLSSGNYLLEILIQ